MDIKILTKEDKDYPKKLLQIKNYPQKLYALGNTILLNKESLAIVGSRDCSEYGKKYAIKFSKELANAGICIVSGMANGIDSAAHIGAIGTLGNTIAVLGAGFNNIYPKENIKLFKKIIDTGGCILTEHEPNVEVKLSNFPKRNRIISAVSMATLVIEAKYRSGSSITAKYSFEQNKKVFCIPRNLEEIHAVGSNNLLKKGAEVVTESQDILDKLKIEKKINKNIKITQIEKIIKNIENEEKIEIKNIPKEYKEICIILKNSSMNVNDLARKTNLNIQKLNEILTIMEIEGYIKRLMGNEFIAI